MRLDNIVPITELKRSAGALVKRAADTQSPIVITQDGRATAVLEDIHSYERRQEAMATLRLSLQGQQGRRLPPPKMRSRGAALRGRARTKSR